MTSFVKIFLIVSLRSATAVQNRVSNDIGRVSGRATPLFLHKRPSALQSKIALEKSRMRASKIAEQKRTGTSMIAESKRTSTNKRDNTHATSASLQPRQHRLGEAIQNMRGDSRTCSQELEWRIFQKLRLKQWEIQAQFDDAFPEWGRIQLLEVWAPFIIYICLLFVAKLRDAPCAQELGLLWITTVVFTMAGINNKPPDERTPKWVTYAILTHFLFCWLPLQHPFVAGWLLFHEKEGIFHANHANFCNVESFIPSSLQSKILDLSKFFSTCSCETLDR